MSDVKVSTPISGEDFDEAFYIKVRLLCKIFDRVKKPLNKEGKERVDKVLRIAEKMGLSVEDFISLRNRLAYD